MKNKELVEILLKQNPEAEVIGTSWNGYVETYGLLDYVYPAKYGQIYNDFFGTPGRMDGRLFEKTMNWEDNTDILLIGSKFGKIPNPDIDCGDDFIDYPIKTLNGKDGDPDLLWKMSGFTWRPEKGVWEKEDDEFYVSWMPETEILEVDNRRNLRNFSGVVEGIETARKVLEICQVPINLAI